MESKASVLVSEEPMAGPLVTFDSQPKFDSLLDKLRKGMSELTSKGDDFTKQMWNMYNTLEDIIISSKMNDNQSVDNIILNNGKPKPITSDDKSDSLSIMQSFSSQSTIDSNNKSFSDFSGTNCVEIQLNNMNSNKFSDELTAKQDIIPTINRNEISECEQSYEESINRILNKSKKFSKINFKNNNIENDSKLSSLDSFDLNSISNTDYSNINKKERINSLNNSNEHIVNPLLDTINTLTSCSDSSDECDMNKKCYINNRNERQRRLFNSRHQKRKTSNYYYSSSDGDSISGYTGSNSLESGYKSDFLSENTPEIIDESSLSSYGTIVDVIEPNVGSNTDCVNHHISDNESNNGNKSVVLPSITSSTTKTLFDKNNCINNSNKNSVKDDKQKNSDICSNTSSESITTNSSSNKKTIGMFNQKIANRLKGFNNDSQLDHLLKLRKSLLKALKRCEQISSPVISRDGSPVISSRSSSPASTVVKSPLTSNLISKPRTIDENNSDRVKSKLVSSPLTIKAEDNSHQQNSHNKCCFPTDSIPSFNPNSNQINNYCINNNSNNNSNSKSVRFNSSVKISSLNPVQHNKHQINSNYGPNYSVNNKSILKDPLCETLRTAVKAGEFKNDSSLEGEIDSLLYGRTGGYYYGSKLEGSGHLEDTPTSTYVTMIEDKYRTFSAHTSGPKHTTSANSKKTSKDYSSLKTGFSSSVSAVSSVGKSHDFDLITTSELRINATLSTTMTRPKTSPYSVYGNSLTVGNKSNRKSKKSHFTEMAKCMLEILDDLQVPQNNLIRDKASNTNKSSAKNPETESIDSLMEELSRAQSDTSDISDMSSLSYRTLPEHHIYEEILYDCLESQPQQSYKYLHYTPRRSIASISSTNTYTHSSVNNIRVDAPLHQSRISPEFKHSNRSLGSWGRTSNKPKQRSNLYSLFSDEIERRNISRSLEREYSKRNPIDINSSAVHNHQNDYGFKTSL